MSETTKNRKVVAGRHIYGIMLNPLEYLLDYEGNVMIFDNEMKAIAYLKELGFTDADIHYFVFEPEDKWRNHPPPI